MTPTSFEPTASDDDDDLVGNGPGSGNAASGNQRAIPLRLLGRSGLARPGGASSSASSLYSSNGSGSSSSSGGRAAGASRFQSRYAAGPSGWRGAQRTGLSGSDERDESVGLLADGAATELDSGENDDDGLGSVRSGQPREHDVRPSPRRPLTLSLLLACFERMS